MVAESDSLDTRASIDVLAPISHIVGLGQSNEMGAQSQPVVSGVDVGFGAYKFVRGIQTRTTLDAPAAPEQRAATDFAFVPLTAAVQEVWTGETPAVGITSQLMAALSAGGPVGADPPASAPHFLFTYPHMGGKHLAELDWRDYETNPSNPIPGPGGYHATFVDDIRRAKVTAAAAALGYGVFAFHFTQGENEGAGYLLPGAPWLTHGAFVPAYKAALAAAYARWDGDARAASGQTRPIPLFISQVNNYWAGQAQAQLAAESPNIFVVGPIYYVPSALNSLWNGTMRGLWVHLSADGQRWRGEQAGKVMSRVLFEGEDWTPLQPRALRRVSDTSIVLSFDVPRPPLAFETEWLPAALGYGFEVSLGTQDAPGADCIIARVELTGSHEVTIGLDPRTPIVADAVAFVTYGQVATVGATAGAVVAIRAGLPYPHGAESTELIFAGDLTAQFAPLLVEGCFVLRQSAEPASRRVTRDSHGATIVARDVRLQDGNTIVRGETRSIVGALAIGLPCAIERDQLFGNLRDSDAAPSVFGFADPSYGTRQGRPYPFQNFCLVFTAPIDVGRT